MRIGRITGIAASGFSPPYGTTVQNLVTFGARVGAFTTSSWSGTSGGLGWKPYYDDVDTTSRSQTQTGLPNGYTYCFSVRARDRAGNVTQWSVPLCTAKMYDDRALSASGIWTRATGRSGFYQGSYSKSTRRYATLRMTGTRGRRGRAIPLARGRGRVHC
ncbi:MAG: hypothetical protein ABJA93_12730, partial [Sporichthyaceae bacterium]